MRIAVLVSGGGTNFQALIDRYQSKGLGGGELALCISSSPTAYALTRAANAGVPAVTLSPKDYATRQEYTDAVTAKLVEEKIDLVVLCGFLYILSPSFCERFANAVINIHPALIPSFCGEGYFGLKVHEAALAYGVKLTGATAHFVTADCDGTGGMDHPARRRYDVLRRPPFGRRAHRPHPLSGYLQSTNRLSYRHKEMLS